LGRTVTAITGRPNFCAFSIARILDDPAFDTRAALIDLRQRLDSEIAQRRDLAGTIDRTLARLDAGKAMAERGLFEGLSAERQAGWEAELIDRFGGATERVIRDAHGAIGALSPAGLLDLRGEIDAIHASFVALIEAGGAPGSSAAQALTQRHYQWVCRSWRPDSDAYAALGRFYVDHTDFRSMFDALHPRLSTFLAEAMAAYSRRSLQGEPR
jgi:hypothetical protein